MINGISGVGSYMYTPYYGIGTHSRQAVSGAQNVQKSAPQQTAASQKAAGGVWTARRSPSLETPVQPVKAVSPLKAGEQSSAMLGLPIREGADPAEMAVRMRIQYVDPSDLKPQQAGNPLTQKDAAPMAQEDAVPAARQAETPLAQESAIPAAMEGADPAAQEGDDTPIEDQPGALGAQAALKEGECQTCKERKYQDDSDDMGVSYQTPTNIAPEQAASAVRGHEMEHVVREQAKAHREDRKVVSQTVTLHTAICPECGKAYVSGGTTRTTTKADNTQDQVQQAAATAKEDAERRPFSAVA